MAVDPIFPLYAVLIRKKKTKTNWQSPRAPPPSTPQSSLFVTTVARFGRVRMPRVPISFSFRFDIFPCLRLKNVFDRRPRPLRSPALSLKPTSGDTDDGQLWLIAPKHVGSVPRPRISTLVTGKQSIFFFFYSLFFQLSAGLCRYSCSSIAVKQSHSESNIGSRRGYFMVSIMCFCPFFFLNAFSWVKEKKKPLLWQILNFKFNMSIMFFFLSIHCSHTMSTIN